jgi:hypothetical protein
MEEAVHQANTLALERHLAGSLDVTGDKLEIREQFQGKQIVKSLFIDGEG